MIGGMSWESTVPYYSIANETVKKKLGGLHSAKILLLSVDFDEVEKCQYAGDWKRCGEIMADAAERLEKAGADFIVICTNTMHKLVPDVKARVKIPVLHIADATADAVKAAGVKKVALLGTQFTLHEPFMKDRLSENGLEVMVPDEPDIQTVNRVIYEELCLGIIKDESRAAFVKVIEKMVRQGAEGVILGCTEIGLLVKAGDVSVPVFDTTEIHATAAAELAMR